MLTIKFNTGNAAFTDEVDGSMDDYCKRHECIRILQEVICEIGDGKDSGAIHDINGNHIGAWSLK